jgi:ParB-like chromosome segregation protein Spo0J
MKADIRVGDAVQVRLNDLVPYPQNPRRGDIQSIAESLSYHGQFKPIVVNKKNNQILAGNHTYKAAKKLGWKQISVVYVDVTDEEGRRIMLADNRLNDLSNYNEPMLAEILKSFEGNLEGTGFNEGDIASLERQIDKGGELFDSSTDKPESIQDDPLVRIAAWQFTINIIAYSAWQEQLMDEAEKSKPKAINIIRERLGIPKPTVSPNDTQKPTKPSTIDNFAKCETVEISELVPYPINPREGDIGAITESLAANGQYRPIVANRATKHILAGNHTYHAAKQLGWAEIAVTWLDVDEEQELKIVLIDNRTSDLASYDQSELKSHLVYISGVRGTGFSQEDINEILSGGASKPQNQAIGRTTFQVGQFKVKASSDELNTWASKVNTWHDVAEMLYMPLEACQEYSTRV